MSRRGIALAGEAGGGLREDVVERAISPGGSSGSDVEALALYITSRSNGMKMNVALSHQKEYDMYKAGEYLFYRRSGQTDFGCVTCHGDAEKRIRLQNLVHMIDKKQIQEVVGSWPAYRGGPMHYADTVGLKVIVDKLKEFQAKFGDQFKPSALLEKLAAEGKGFAAL